MEVRSPDERQAVLRRLRALKMARSQHAYVRGSTEQFYTWLASDAGTSLPDGPKVWICGDCHVGNLGPVGRIEGAAAIEIRDLDQTIIGNPAHDLVRLGLSLAMAARNSRLPGVTTTRITEALVAGYESAFDGEIPSEQAKDLPNPLRFVMRRAIRRTRKHLFGERVGSKRDTFPFGRKFWPLSPDELAGLRALVESVPIHHLVTKLESRPDDARVEFLDAAYWVKGCSSLGLWRAAVLVDVIDINAKKKSARTRCLLDFKEAVDPAPPGVTVAGLAEHPAARVVSGARRIAPALGERMVATQLLDHSVFVRELLPQDLKIELDQLDADDATPVAHYLGMVVGRAHARQLDAEGRRHWQAEMASRRTKQIDAPSWLWHAVVDLVGVHERAYLEHCRVYAVELDRATRAS